MAAMYDALGNYIGEDGLDAPVKTLQQTQATSARVPAGVNNGSNTGAKAVPRVNIATVGAGFGAGVSEFGDDAPVAPTEGGNGQQDDSSQSDTPINTANAVNVNANVANEQVEPKPNILDTFSSYTYHASVYMMSPAQYRSLAVSKKKSVNGYQLLFQSGGAPNNTGGFQGGLAPGAEGTAASLRASEATAAEISAAITRNIPGAGSADAGRNPAFPLDFYIDSITIENLLSGRGSRAAHAVSSIKFTVVEPLGITLIDRIYQAAQDFIPKNGAGNINYNAVSYLMVIKFYGYDANGNLVPGIKGADASTSLSDPNAVVEKFIPFRLSKLDWAVSNKLVTYEFEGKALNMMVGAGTRRGTIPYDVQLNAGTVGNLLGSNALYTATQSSAAAPGASTTAVAAQARADAAGSDPRRVDQASGGINTVTGQAIGGETSPSKANSAPTTRKIVKQGLMGAMNDFQYNICQGANAIFSVPDTYKIVWVPAKDGGQPIRDATIVLPGKVKESASTGFGAPITQDPKNADPSRVSKDTTTRNFSITAGMQIVQAIDLAIRNSSYVIDQALTIRNTQTGEDEPNSQKFGKPVQWYNICFQALPKDYDELRNDTAFDITFYITPFTIEQYDSRYFPLTKFRGVHKRYQYLFTGKNTAVLDYKEQLNSLYNLTVSGSSPKNSAAERQRRARTSSMRDIPFYAYQSASTESRQGTEGQALEPSANLAESFYSPADLAKTTLRIIGDPAWVQQGSFAGGIDPSAFNWSPFLPDGTINFDAMQILFEVAWQRPEDYDLNTGLANPYNRPTSQNGQPGASRVYVAKKCVSEFRQGKFEQVIEGSLYTFPIPNAANKAATASVPDESAAETQRLQRQNDILLRNSSAQGASPTEEQIASAANYGSNTPALPAPTLSQTSTAENNTPTISPPAPVLQPQDPPQPPTSGSGEDVESRQNIPPPAIGRVTLEGLAPAPTDPQEITREA